jgi:GNAT superfamily N-acetyltransferase
MFIGWLKFANVNDIVKVAEDVGWLVDGYHLKLMMMHSPHLAYGAYEDGQLIGVIMAIEFEHTAQIKYFMMKPTYQNQGYGKRLFETLLGALRSDYQSLYIHANPKLQSFFENYGFETKTEVGRFLNVGKVPPFNFTNAHAKELDGSNFESVISKIDMETFGGNRMDFLLDEMERNSSLKFTQPNGFQHSSVVNARAVYLGPWQVREGHDEEAEKMMRGVLYFRGLKKVFADVPMINDKAVALFKAYHFEKKTSLLHMSLGSTNIKFENIYSFSL